MWSPETYIKFALRSGKMIAGHLYLPRKEGDKVEYSRKVGGGLVVDFTDDNRAIGVEITSPSQFSVQQLNKLLAELHQPQITGKLLVPA